MTYNKSGFTGHATIEGHGIDWNRTKVVNWELNRRRHNQEAIVGSDTPGGGT